VKRMLAAALALGLLAAPARPEDVREEKEEAPRRRIEVAFVLDTTGSMGGLIETAKRKIWSIANEIVGAKPTPEIRMGLVAYRDRGDDYVTKVVDLDTDLDRVYGELTALRAGGGGDGPESVNQGLREAVTRLGWSKEDAVLRMVFLVGDAPPHMDYANDVPYTRTCEDAVRAGLVVNTLQCGGDESTARVWRDIAERSEGRFAVIPQEGSAAVATPFDERIGALGSELSGTYLGFGSEEERDRGARKLKDGEELARAAAPAAEGAAVAADRAGLIARSGRLDDSDLVDAVAGGRVKLEEVDADELPDAMKELTLDERKEYVARRAEERAAVRKKLETLNAKRAAFLAEATKKAAAAGKSTFDMEVGKMIRAQAEKKGFTFE